MYLVQNPPAPVVDGAAGFTISPGLATVIASFVAAAVLIWVSSSTAKRQDEREKTMHERQQKANEDQRKDQLERDRESWKRERVDRHAEFKRELYAEHLELEEEQYRLLSDMLAGLNSENRSRQSQDPSQPPLRAAEAAAWLRNKHAEDFERIGQYRDRRRRTQRTIMLISSQAVRDAMLGCTEKLAAATYLIGRGNVEMAPIQLAEGATELDNMRKELRVDLGIDDGHDSGQM